MKVEKTGVLRNQFTIVFLIAILVHDIAHCADAADQPQQFSKLDRSAVVSTAPVDYPYEARRGRITGSGVVVIEIDRTTGKVKSAYMAPSTGSSILDYAALSRAR